MIKFYNSLRYALAGISAGLKGQRNIKIQLSIALLAIVAGIWLKVTRLEWALIFICIGLVLALELMNTAIEKLADKLHPGEDSEIGKVKDIAAGAVLVISICAALAGFAIFYVRIMALFDK